MKKVHYAYPKIQNFNQVVKLVQERAEYHNIEPPILGFLPTVKLHGSNTSIVLDWENKTLYAQSRNKIISSLDDLYGFAKWVEQNSKILLNFFHEYYYNPISKFSVFYGEWCGKGIQKGVSISQIERSWFLFGKADIDQSGSSEIVGIGNIWSSYLPEINLYSLRRFSSETVLIDFKNPQIHEEKLKTMVEEIEKECPVAASFGHSGIGEGLVFHYEKGYLYNRHIELSGFRTDDITFKVKGLEHRVASSKYAKSTFENFENFKPFIDQVCNENRFNQGISITGEPSFKNIGAFLKWVATDIITEEAETIEINNFNRSDVTRNINNKAKAFYVNLIKGAENGVNNV